MSLVLGAFQCTSAIVAGQLRRCAIRVTLENQGESSIRAGVAGFRLSGPAGAESPSTAPAGEIEALGSDPFPIAHELAPGTQVNGLVIFDLAIGRRYDELTWSAGGSLARRALGEALTVSAPRLVATGFTVTLDAGSSTVDGSPNLIALRDAAIADLKRNLPQAWSGATRGLGKLTVVDRDPGIPIRVFAASGTSVHRRGGNIVGQEISIYVAEAGGRVMTGNEVVSTVLHELGHIWCCFGSDSTEGHWVTPQDDGRFFGLSRYGLMNSPVRCNIQPDRTQLCPDRFSDRELATMGFTTPPAATPDPCVAEADGLRTRLDTLGRQLDQSRARLDEVRARVRSLEAQLAPYSAYRNGIPPDQYAQYQALFTQYQAAIAQENREVATYNAIVAERTPVADRYNQLAPRCLS